MTSYATSWYRCWSLLVTGGVGLSLLVWRPMSVVVVFLAAAACAGIVLAMLAPPPAPHRPSPAVPWTRVGARSVVVGGTVVAVGACATVLPYLVLPLILLASLSSPSVAHQLQHRGRGADPVTSAPGSLAGSGARTDEGTGAASAPETRQEPAEDTVAARTSSWTPPAECRLDVTAATVQALSASELCDQWRRTFVALQSAGSADERIRVVAQRQVYLDEVERRCPTAFRAWLASGARAASGPDRFLVDGQPRGRVDPA